METHKNDSNRRANAAGEERRRGKRERRRQRPGDVTRSLEREGTDPVGAVARDLDGVAPVDVQAEAGLGEHAEHDLLEADAGEGRAVEGELEALGEGVVEGLEAVALGLGLEDALDVLGGPGVERREHFGV